MTEKKVILVTGVADYWGGQVAARLVAKSASQNDPKYHVIGLDVEPPNVPIDGLDFIEADIRNPLVVDLLKSEKVHTVCHLVFEESVRTNKATFDKNVMGTMKVLGACAEAGVKKVVIKSSMIVYGAQPGNPAFIMEDQPIKGRRSFGYTRDRVEIEVFCNGFRRQYPEMIVTLLRFPSIIGQNVDTPMTRFLKQPLSPVLMGFDPLMQMIHEQDVVDALVHAVEHDADGVFNVAAEGILPLRKLARLSAKIPIPVFHLCAYRGAGILGRTGAPVGDYIPVELDYLRYPWVGDLAKMRNELGFAPRYTAEEALREFAGDQQVRQYMPESAALTYDEERLRDTLERRRRIREREAENK